MTQDARAILTAAIGAVDPYRAVKRHFSSVKSSQELQIIRDSSTSDTYSMKDYDTIIIVAFGKASSRMAQAVVEQVEQVVTNVDSHIAIKGVVIAKDDHVDKEEHRGLARHPSIRVQEASHPVPDARSEQGAALILDMVREYASPRTLVVTCISGGGSALFCQPKPPLTLEDLQQTNSLLLSSGMTINEMNVIRKRLETGKGGQLAMQCYPSTVVTLVLSDVLGDPLDLIASGPTVPDTSSVQDAWELVQRHAHLESALPRSVIDLLKSELRGDANDTPSPSHPVFSDPRNAVVLVGNNERAVQAAAAEADRHGYQPIVLGTRFEGEARVVAGVYTAMAQQLTLQRDQPEQATYAMSPLPAALIAGGETTVTLANGSGAYDIGKGGRNQELALVAAQNLKDLGLRNVVLASAGTDGTDGPTDAAGAVVDGGTIQRLDALSDYTSETALRRHDTYTYLRQEDADGNCPLIRTGPTGTNVADVCVVLVK